MAVEQLNDQEAPGRKCELKIWHTRHKKDGSEETVAVDSLEHLEPDVEEYALVVKRSFDANHRLESTTLTVNSPHILKALQDVAKSHPTVAADFREAFTMESPFQMLYHIWDDLVTYRRGLKSDDARMHVQLLLSFMQTDMGVEKKRYDTQIHGGMITFPRLWLLFRPGDTVVAHVKSHPWLLKVTKTAYEESISEGKYLDVHCTYSDQ